MTVTINGVKFELDPSRVYTAADLRALVGAPANWVVGLDGAPVGAGALSVAPGAAFTVAAPVDAAVAVATVNAAVRDTILQHGHYIFAVSDYVLGRMTRQFDRAMSTMLERLAGLLLRGGSAGAERRVRAKIDELTGLLRVGGAAANGTLVKLLQDTFRAELAAQAGILREALPWPIGQYIGVSLDKVPLAFINKLIQTPLGGRTLNNRLKTLLDDAAGAAKSELLLGLTLGESVEKLVQRLKDHVKGPWRRNATRIVRTEVIRVSAAAAIEAYRANQDVLDGVEWVATFDDRVCPECSKLDGTIFYFVEGALPGAESIPLHPCCRCCWAPVTKSWSDLGFTPEELGVSPELAALDHRESVIGQNPTYPVWFARQPRPVQRAILGARRWQLWSEGRLTFNGPREALPKQLKPMAPAVLAELRGLAGNAKPRPDPAPVVPGGTGQ